MVHLLHRLYGVDALAAIHLLLTYHVHGRQHASRALQSDVWNRFVAGRAARSVDDQAGDGRPTSVILLYLNELD